MPITGNLQYKHGKYYAVINLYDGNGKRKQKWINTNLTLRGNKKQAERFLREQLSLYEKIDISPDLITVSEYFSKWLKVIEKTVRPNTFRNYKGNMENHIIPYFENKGILLKELKPSDLETYYFSKLEAGSKIKSMEALSPTTIKHHHQNISKALNDAMRQGLIIFNPASPAKTPKVKSYKGDFDNPEELKELLLLFKGSVIELPVRLCSFYGFRRSEVLGLKWSKAIDFVNRTISIKETLQQCVGGDYTDDTKTESSCRTLPMPDEIYDLLMEHKNLQNEREHLMGDYYIHSDYVCTWENGKVISPNYLSSKFHKVIMNSNLKKIRFHDLRHSASTNLLSMGFSFAQVKEWLGHESAATTAKYYAHADKSSKNKMSEAMEKALSNKTK